jgi:hypothetical protein
MRQLRWRADTGGRRLRPMGFVHPIPKSPLTACAPHRVCLRCSGAQRHGARVQSEPRVRRV